MPFSALRGYRDRRRFAAKLQALGVTKSRMARKQQAPYPPLEDVYLTPDACLNAAWTLLNELTVNPDTRLYLYAALEMRLLLERLLRDALVMMAPTKLSKSQWKLYLAVDLDREIRRIRPDFDSRWRFLQQLYRGRRPSVRLPDMDLRALTRTYGLLGRYLHSPGTPFTVLTETTWKDGLEYAIDAAYTLLEPFGKLYRDFAPPTAVFGVEVEWAFNQFRRGRLDQHAARVLGRKLSAIL